MSKMQRRGRQRVLPSRCAQERQKECRHYQIANNCSSCILSNFFLANGALANPVPAGLPCELQGVRLPLLGSVKVFAQTCAGTGGRAPSECQSLDTLRGL